MLVKRAREKARVSTQRETRKSVGCGERKGDGKGLTLCERVSAKESVSKSSHCLMFETPSRMLGLTERVRVFVCACEK